MRIINTAAALLIGSPGLAGPTAPVEVVEIKHGQSLMSLVREHGITLVELKDLNPGVQLSSLSVGDKVRVAKAGSLWPDVPKDSTTKDTVQKQRIRQQIEQRRKAEQLVALRKAEERIRRYRRFGSITFYWSTWGKSGSGIRSVKARGENGLTEIAVDCRNYKISKLKYQKWQSWTLPTGGLIDFVAEGCANVLGASKPIYVKPEVVPVVREEPKTAACTGPTILCGMP